MGVIGLQLRLCHVAHPLGDRRRSERSEPRKLRNNAGCEKALVQKHVFGAILSMCHISPG